MSDEKRAPMCVRVLDTGALVLIVDAFGSIAVSLFGAESKSWLVLRNAAFGWSVSRVGDRCGLVCQESRIPA